MGTGTTSTIIVDRSFASAPFFLRIEEPHKGVQQVELSDANGPVQSLPAAVRAALAKGFRPTHWYIVGSEQSWTIPAGIAHMSPPSAPTPPAKKTRRKRV